jgi:peptidoglycan-N-acetylmuramic acid deacetylase
MHNKGQGSEKMKIIASFIIACMLTLVVPTNKLLSMPVNASENAVSRAEGEMTDINTTQLDSLDNTKQGWGMGKQVDNDNRPVSCKRFQDKYGKYDAIFIKENTKNIYLTFDEGYENGYTSKILDVLKEKKAPAVFFVTYDYVKRNPELVQRMIDEGHVVGNHSYTHPSMPTLSLSKASNEITALHNYVKENFNYTMTLFRPPMGEFSERTLALTQSLGYKSVFWSFAYVDWDTNKQMGFDQAYTKVVSCLHNGAVYLLHAVSKDNAEILGSFIDEAEKEGYQFEKLS